jgi:hypothetical protein
VRLRLVTLWVTVLQVSFYGHFVGGEAGTVRLIGAYQPSPIPKVFLGLSLLWVLIVAGLTGIAFVAFGGTPRQPQWFFPLTCLSIAVLEVWFIRRAWQRSQRDRDLLTWKIQTILRRPTIQEAGS